MQIMKTVKKVPGGLMLVPLLLGALVHTFTPGAGEYLGGFTNGLITGTTPILAVWLFCIGASISLKASGMVLRKSGTLVLTKILVAWVVVAIGLQFLPIEGIQNGIFAGYSVLALVVAFDMTNAGLFASLMQQYGTKEDAGAFVLMSLEAGPLVSMLILGSTGAAYFEPQLFVGAILPFLIGFLLGNLDPECNKFFSRATETIIPFFGFALGNNIDLSVITKTGISGISLALLVIVISGIPLMLADKFIGKGDGTAGLAASAVAGQAVANPMIIAELKPEFLPAAQSATAMVATAMVVTAILVPILTAYYTKWAQKRFKSTIVSVDTTKESSANT